MSEPCESCGTQITLVSLASVILLMTGELTDVAPQWHETESLAEAGRLRLSWIRHTPARCRAARERLHGASGAEGAYQWHRAPHVPALNQVVHSRADPSSGSSADDPQVRF